MLVELHCHTCYSDGLPRPEELVRYSEQRLGAVAITDHDTQEGYRTAKKYVREKNKKNLLLIPGIEVTCYHNGDKYHILIFGVEGFDRKFSRDALETIDRARESGGVVVIAHPFRRLGYSFHQRELWKKVDAVEVLNGNTLMFRNMRAYKQAKRMKKNMTAGSDAHVLKAVGKYACEINANSVDGILKAIKKGKITLPEKTTNPIRIVGSGLLRKSKLHARRVMGGF